MKKIGFKVYLNHSIFIIPCSISDIHFLNLMTLVTRILLIGLLQLLRTPDLRYRYIPARQAGMTGYIYILPYPASSFQLGATMYQVFNLREYQYTCSTKQVKQ